MSMCCKQKHVISAVEFTCYVPASKMLCPPSPEHSGDSCVVVNASAALFICERQTLEKVQTQFCGHSVEFMSENGFTPHAVL